MLKQRLGSHKPSFDECGRFEYVKHKTCTENHINMEDKNDYRKKFKTTKFRLLSKFYEFHEFKYSSNSFNLIVECGNLGFVQFIG